MSRIPGRPGRNAGRGLVRHHEPRYLSVKPPVLPSVNPPPLQNNPYEVLANAEYPRLHTVKIDEYGSIQTYSKNSKEFLDSLKCHSTPLEPLPCVSHNIDIQQSCDKLSITNNLEKNKSHYQRAHDKNSGNWNIIHSRKLKQTQKKKMSLWHRSISQHFNSVTHSKSASLPKLIKPTMGTHIHKNQTTSLNSNNKSKQNQFFRTPSDNKITMNIPIVVNSFLQTINIKTITTDKVRTAFQRLGALSFIPFCDWLRYQDMEVEEMREHLRFFVAKNQRDVDEKVDHKPILTYDEISKNATLFKPTHLAIAEASAIRQLIIEAYNEMSVPFDSATLDNKDRNQLICTFYDTLTVMSKNKNKVPHIDLTSNESMDSMDDTPPKPKVTPLKRPPNESPERYENDASGTNMDVDNLYQDIQQEILTLTYAKLQLLTRTEMMIYLVYQQKKYGKIYPDGYLINVNEDKLREELLLFALELHDLCTPSVINETTIKDDID